VQFNVYVCVPEAVGVTAREPDAGCEPLHAPLAVQFVPEFDDQVSVAL
jgi:hypothetical protein